MAIEHNQDLEIRGPSNDLVQEGPPGELSVNVSVAEGAPHSDVVVQGPLGGEGDADGIEVVVDQELEDLVQAAGVEAKEHIRVADLRVGIRGKMEQGLSWYAVRTGI